MSRGRSRGRLAHGETVGRKTSAEYRIWTQMLGRCGTPSHARFADYGGRGIYVCERWRADLGAFIEDMGRRPSPDHQLDRIDNDGPYSPENCRWATRIEQGRNRRNNVLLTFNGETLPLSEWAERTGIGYTTLRRRVKVWGWTHERALTEKDGRRNPARIHVADGCATVIGGAS